MFKLRTPDDAIGLRAFVQEKPVRRAVVAGGGFIGLEAAENLKAQGVAVTVVDLAEQIMPNVLDPEMAAYAQKHLVKNGIRVLTGTRLEAVLGEGRLPASRPTAA